MAALSKQENFAVNTNKSQVYIEDDATPLSYNYKTNQWSSITDYAGIGFYSVDSGVNIGLARISGTAVDLQQPDVADPATEAIITTGESTFSDGSRRIVTGIRPLLTANDAKVSLFTRDTLNPTGRSNFFLQSEDLSAAAWTKNAATVTTNQVVAPDGSTTADLLEGDGTTAVHGVTQTAQNVGTSSGAVTVSGYFKYSVLSYVQIYHQYNATTDNYVYFNIQDGNVGGLDNTSGIITGYGIDTADNGFFRVYVSFSGLGDATPDFSFRWCDSSGDAVQPYAVGSYVWGLMVEQSDSVGEYIESGVTVGSVTLDQTTESSINSRSGVAPFRSDSRYHRVRLRVSGGFTTILGADVEYYPTGEI